MSSIGTIKDWVAVSTGAKLVIVHTISEKQITLELPPVRPAPNENKAKTVVNEDPQKNVIAGLTFSDCGKYISAYSTAKQIIIWETETWSLVSERYMPKAASSIKFTPDSHSVIIVDKAGDAVSFSLIDPRSEGQVILGHLSMLLDVIITPDGKQIITCDRDEKIRVSHYPNAYNIVSYCLGHKEFVSSLCLLPHDPSHLLSSSGDGTLQLWEFQSGKNALTYNCFSDVSKKLSSVSSAFVHSEDSGKHSVIVKKVRCFKLNDTTSIICTLFYGYKGCLVYHLKKQNFELIQSLCVDNVILDLCFGHSGELLLRLTNTESNNVIQCYLYDVSCNKFSILSETSKLAQSLACIDNILKSGDEQFVPLTDMTQFLKRTFDNVKGYYEQKKIRLGEQ